MSCVGNACIIKPSELSVATSNLIAELVPKYLDQVLYSNALCVRVCVCVLIETVYLS